MAHRLGAQTSDQFQFRLKINVMRQFDVFEKACRLNVVGMHQDELFVLCGRADKVFAQLAPAQGAI